MNPVRRRLLSCFVTAALLVVVGCGSEPAKPGAGERAAKPSNLAVGVHIPLTRESVRIWGVWARQGIEVATATLREGGINVDVEYNDDINDAKNSQEAAASFMAKDRKVWLAYLSRASTAIAPAAKENRAVLITNTYTPGITDLAAGSVFRVGQNAGADSRAMAKFLAEHHRGKSLAILHVQTPAGEQAADILAKEYAALGGKVFPAVAYDANEKDFRPKALQVKALAPDLLYVYSYNELGTVIRTAREAGIKAVICTNDVAEVPEFFERAGRHGDGVFYTALPFDVDAQDTAVKAFRQAFEKTYPGSVPDVHAATWFDTVMLLGRSWQSSDGTVDGLKNALLATRDYRGVTGTITIGPNGDVDREVTIKVTRGGRYSLWKPSN